MRGDWQTGLPIEPRTFPRCRTHPFGRLLNKAYSKPPGDPASQPITSEPVVSLEATSVSTREIRDNNFLKLTIKLLG
jgi:hypothetical protein